MYILSLVETERIYATMLLYISVCLRTRQDSMSYNFIYIVQKLETGDRDRGTPKLFRNYSEITPKLRTVELWNYSETGDRDRDRGTPKTVACYSPLLVLVCWSVSQDPHPQAD